jgi:hypothetical protein
MWSDGYGMRKLRLRTGGEFPVERPGLHRPSYFLIFEPPSGVEVMDGKFMKLEAKPVD